MSIPINEQETTINFSRDKRRCDVWTSDTTVMTKLDRLCEESPKNYKLVEVGKVDGETVDKCYIISDKRLISFRRDRVVLSDAAKEERAKRMREYHRGL